RTRSSALSLHDALPIAHKRIGFVGMVPQRKRIDLALDLLEELLETDSGFTLAVKGHTPEAFPWLCKREEEMEYYKEQFRRIEQIDRKSTRLNSSHVSIS